jgi:hypothetical protein
MGTLQVGAMHTLGISKISKTDMLISPLKTCSTLLHLHVASVEPLWSETTHFQKWMYMQDVLCSAIAHIM